MNKLKSVVIDNDMRVVNALENLCRGSDAVEVTNSFNNPAEFLKKAPTLDYDLCIMDVTMREMDGLVVAQMLNSKPFIFVTSEDKRLREALNLCPVDIVPKPVLKDRLNSALEKAYKLFSGKRDYAVFNVAESDKRLNVYIPDVMLVSTDSSDARHKEVLLKSGEKYTFMDCALNKLLELSSRLVQVNKGQLVSIDAVDQIKHDLITLKGIEKHKPAYITLSRTYRNSFKEKLFYR